jgi:hypothetical protein
MTAAVDRGVRLLDSRSPAFGYFVLCVTSTVATSVLLMGRGQSALVGLLFLAAGMIGVFMRLSMAPPLIVLCSALCLMLRQWLFLESADQVDPKAMPRFRDRDLFLAISVLGYVVGHYRLQAVGWHVFPPDYRYAYLKRVKQWPADAWQALAQRRRDVNLVKPTELILAVVSLPVWAMAAQMLWLWLARPRGFFDWGPEMVRAGILVLALVPMFLATTAGLRHMRLRRMQPAEARMVVQDVLWNELRGPLRMLSRWLAWCRLRQRQDRE